MHDTRTPIRIGLIGAGRIGQVHAASIRAAEGAELVHVADPVPASLQALGLDPGIVTSSDPSAVFNDENVDAVIIASPTNTHLDHITAAISADKPVLCEKPVDLDLGRAESLSEAVARATVPVAMGFNRRFDPGHARLRARLLEGEIGELEQLTIVSRDPAPASADYIADSGGIFRDMTIHDFDLARHFVPGLSTIIARGDNQKGNDLSAFDDFASAVTVLTGDGGKQVTIINSRHCSFGYDQRIEAFGAEGMLQSRNISESTVTASTARGVDLGEPYEWFFLERYAEAYRLEIVEFLKAVRGEENRCPTFVDGVEALRIAVAADRSARQGVAIDIAAVSEKPVSALPQS